MRVLSGASSQLDLQNLQCLRSLLVGFERREEVRDCYHRELIINTIMI